MLLWLPEIKSPVVPVVDISSFPVVTIWPVVDIIEVDMVVPVVDISEFVVLLKDVVEYPVVILFDPVVD